MNILGTAFTFTLALNVCLAFYLQMNKVEVFPGESVLLPCNSSGFSSDELHWEAMGRHVAVLHEGNITAGQGYEDRVFLNNPTAPEDFSLVLRDVMFNDGGIYECLWKGQKPVCSVFVDVLKPLVFPVFAAVGEDVTLHCFGNIPTYNPWEDIDVQWLKDEREVLRFISGKIDMNADNSHMSLPVREEISRGIFSLTITSVRSLDQGVYQCLYKSSDYKAPQNGLPETHTLTVLDVSSEVSSTVESIPSASSYIETSSSVSARTDVVSTEWSSPVSSHSYETDVISTASAQTSANTPEVSSTVDSIISISNSSYNETSSSVSAWTDVVSTEWSSPVSSHSYVERTETDVISTASAQTSANTPEVSSTVESILSNSSHPHTSSSVSARTDVVSTEWSSPVSTNSYVKTKVISTASAQMSADTVEEMTDVPPVLETGTSSGQYSSLELLMDEKIPWILIGLIGGVLLITAGVLISLVLFSRN